MTTKKMSTILVLAAIFMLGWLSSIAYSNYSISLSEQQPLLASKERLSPADHIKESQISVSKDKIIIDINNAIAARYVNTNSMDPVFDSEATGIEIRPSSPSNIAIGDIIAYQASWTDGIVIHRVIALGNDSLGLYYITKGDNNPSADPQKVRFSQVKYILVGIIY